MLGQRAIALTAPIFFSIHREGQTRICVIYRFLTSGTVDEVIYQRQLTKLALSGAIMVRWEPSSPHLDDRS